MTKRFIGENGRIKAIETVEVEFKPVEGSRPQLVERPCSVKTWPAELVLLAMGFLGPETDSIVSQLECDLDERGNVKVSEDDYASSTDGVFACGDTRRGQSLVVWAISEGREAARSVDTYLTGSTRLPTKGEGDLPRV